jgi:hypothetical protein
MVSFTVFAVGFAAATAMIGVGGGLYEFSVVDPYWPRAAVVQQA